jgi:hypothetical protein
MESRRGCGKLKPFLDGVAIMPIRHKSLIEALTVGVLRERIRELPDDMPVVIYGESTTSTGGDGFCNCDTIVIPVVPEEGAMSDYREAEPSDAETVNVFVVDYG